MGKNKYYKRGNRYYKVTGVGNVNNAEVVEKEVLNGSRLARRRARLVFVLAIVFFITYAMVGCSALDFITGGGDKPEVPEVIEIAPSKETPKPDETAAEDDKVVVEEIEEPDDEVVLLPGLEDLPSIPDDPFMGPMKLAGIIRGSDNTSFVILKMGNRSFIAKEGDVINGMWKIKRISRNTVTLENGTNDMVLDIRYDSTGSQTN